MHSTYATLRIVAPYIVSYQLIYTFSIRRRGKSFSGLQRWRARAPPGGLYIACRVRDLRRHSRSVVAQLTAPRVLYTRHHTSTHTHTHTHTPFSDIYCLTLCVCPSIHCQGLYRVTRPGWPSTTP